MISKFFKSEFYVQLFVLLVSTIIFYFIKSSDIQEYTKNFPNSLINISIENNILKDIISYIIIILSSLLILRIFTINDFTNKKSLLPAFIFCFSAIILKNSPYFQQIIITNLILIFAFGDILKIYNKTDSYEEIYNNSFLLSLSSIIYLPSIYFTIIIWLTLIVFRIFNWREWVISIIGLITPYFLVFAFFFLTDNLDKNLLIFKSFFKGINLGLITLHTKEKIFIYIFVVFFIISFFSVMNRFSDKNIYFRKKITIFLNLTALCIIILILSITESKGNFLYITTSFSLFFTSYIDQMKTRWLREVFLGILILTYITLLI